MCWAMLFGFRQRQIDTSQVSLKPTANGLRSTQDSHDIDISVGGDPFHTPGDDTEEVNFSIATSPLRYGMMRRCC